MNRLLNDIEFFTYEREVWVRYLDGSTRQLTESDTTLIDSIIDSLTAFYPKAYKALCSEYKGCTLNHRYFRFRIVSRFIRCNFAQLDNVPDFSSLSGFNFEYIQCPLRGECKHEFVICRPEFNHCLSSAELPVLRLWFEGCSVDEIANALCLSPHTVHNHIRNAYQKLGLHSRSEFVKYASSNKLFS